MSEFGRSGGQLPHDEASTREHFKEMEEDLHHEREGERAAEKHPRRPWWRLWAKRSA
ncbi:MAG TPA: hypothetical protein VFP13_03305 [Actinomycetota bacterium]|nr:hypothetical protein [Actinomycetota bacterium]